MTGQRSTDRPPTLGVGVDIGGTKVAAGLVDADGTILDSVSEPTPAGGKIAALVADLVDRLRERATAPVAGIGVGAAGFVSADRSTVTFAPNIDWRDEPLGADIARLLDLPVVVENDANAAAWGEYRFGAGADSDDLLLVTIGTGVGGGVIQDGDLVRGGFGAAAEVGHLRLVRDGRLCGCGQHGCFEQYASGSALVHDARERAASDDPTAAALLARAHRLDRRIERQDVGRLGDLVDLLAGAAHLVHRRGKAGDMLGQRFDQAEQIADLVQRVVDHRRTVPEPFDRAFGQQPGLVARFEHLALILVERPHGALQLAIFAAQVAERIDHALDDARHIGTADGDLAAGGRNLIESGRAALVDRAEFHVLTTPLFVLISEV